MYGKYEHLVELDNLYHFFHPKEYVPGKLEPGNPSYELAYSLTGILDYFSEIGERAGVTGTTREKILAAFDQITNHENILGEKLLAYLRSRADVRIVGRERGDDPLRVPTISLVVEGRDPAEIARKLEDFNIAVRFGDFYARRLVDFLGYSKRNGVLRVSIVHYNTVEEVERLIEVLDEVV
jgi:selenocysteine lyase/cysteine desulfurase